MDVLIMNGQGHIIWANKAFKIVLLKMVIITSEKDFSDLEHSWTALADQADVTIFQTFEWNRTWWKYFGKKGALHILLFYDRDKLVGIIPLFWDTITYFGVTIYTALRFLGSNISQAKGKKLIGLISYTDYLNAIILPGYERAVFGKFIDYIKQERAAYDELLLDAVSGNSAILGVLIPLLESKGIAFEIKETMSSQVVVLPQSWEKYLTSLSKNRRYQTRLALKRGTDEEIKVFEIEETDQEEGMLLDYEQLCEMHQKKWNSLGALGSFYEDRSYQFYKEVTLKFFRRGWAKFFKAVPVSAKDQCAAFDLVYEYKHRLFAVHGVADHKSPHYKMGPGIVLLAVTLKNAIEQQSNMYDFLRGCEEYKLGYANKEIKNKTVFVYPISRKGIKFSSRLAKEYQFKIRQLNVELLKASLFFRDHNVPVATQKYIQFIGARIRNKLYNS